MFNYYGVQWSCRKLLIISECNIFVIYQVIFKKYMFIAFLLQIYEYIYIYISITY